MVLIRQIALDFMLGVSRELHPREFMGMIRFENGKITEVLIPPASIWGEGFSEISLMNVPHDKTIIGSVHSHPSSNYRPSRQDLVEFGRSGKIHIILRYPYQGIDDVACYDDKGNMVKLEVVE